MLNARLVLGTLGFIAVVTMALAKSAVDDPHWLTNDQIKAIVASEPSPPAPGSDAEKTDLQEEIAAQNNRTSAQIAEAKRDETYSISLFTYMIQPKITPQADPVAFRFFDRVNKQIGKVVRKSKDQWKRPRPYLGHPDVVHSLFPAADYSYPSGHSTHSFAFAVVLGRMFPDQAQAFLARAHQIAQSRVDAGVHYETDIKEGEVVGREIAKEMLANPEFEQELHAARAEVAAQK
jgi:acid phosphatase (class A)